MSGGEGQLPLVLHLGGGNDKWISLLCDYVGMFDWCFAKVLVTFYFYFCLSLLTIQIFKRLTFWPKNVKKQEGVLDHFCFLPGVPWTLFDYMHVIVFSIELCNSIKSLGLILTHFGWLKICYKFHLTIHVVASCSPVTCWYRILLLQWQNKMGSASVKTNEMT